MISELEVFPQITYSEQQGQIGNRRWSLDGSDDVAEFVKKVCASHWPGQPDSIPILVQSGAFFDGVNIKSGGERTLETLGVLPKYGKSLVTAQYALHRMTNAWPDTITKPAHPKGTTLSLRVRGSGQMLLVTPSGVRPGTLSPSMLCESNPESVTSGSQALGTMIVVPIVEYHISCDRMTKDQVDTALNGNAWDKLQGTVNAKNPNAPSDFLNAPEGTLLFDGYDIQETYCCDPVEPLRYCLTACLRKRVITGNGGVIETDADGVVVGWNHDFINLGGDKGGWGWKTILLRKGDSCQPRYPFGGFHAMFCPEEDYTPPGAETPISDCYFCRSYI